MKNHLLTFCIATALTVSLHAQPPTPATQPARPADRPPTGEPSTPLPAPEPDLGGARDRDRGDDRSLNRRPNPEGGDANVSELTLTGCLERVNPKAFRLRQIAGRDDTVTEDVRLQGALDQLRPMIGRVVEVRGTYEQATPTTTDAYFSVARVREVARTCEAR